MRDFKTIEELDSSIFQYIQDKEATDILEKRIHCYDNDYDHIKEIYESLGILEY